MQQPFVIKRTLSLPAAKDVVWNALTNPFFTKQYMFNCEVITNWCEGDVIIWMGVYEGCEMFMKGLIMQCSPYESLQYSIFDTYYEGEDVPDNYVHIAYELEEQDNHTKLTITIDNFRNNYNRYAQTRHAWDVAVLPALQGLFDEPYNNLVYHLMTENDPSYSTVQGSDTTMLL